MNNVDVADMPCATATVTATPMASARNTYDGMRAESGAPKATRIVSSSALYAISKRATVPFTSVMLGRSPSSASSGMTASGGGGGEVVTLSTAEWTRANAAILEV